MNSNGTPKEKFTFSDSEKVEKILSQYPDKKSATLPLLHLAQSEKAYISSSVINTVAHLVDCHPAVVMDCVSFYTMLYTKPHGRHIIQVCQTLSCSLNGADTLVDHMTGKYGIKPGERVSYYDIIKRANSLNPYIEKLTIKNENDWTDSDRDLSRVLSEMNEIDQDKFARLVKLIPPIKISFL